jgi:hypothetical protein
MDDKTNNNSSSIDTDVERVYELAEQRAVTVLESVFRESLRRATSLRSVVVDLTPPGGAPVRRMLPTRDREA